MGASRSGGHSGMLRLVSTLSFRGGSTSDDDDDSDAISDDEDEDEGEEEEEEAEEEEDEEEDDTDDEQEKSKKSKSKKAANKTKALMLDESFLDKALRATQAVGYVVGALHDTLATTPTIGLVFSNGGLCGLVVCSPMVDVGGLVVCCLLCRGCVHVCCVSAWATEKG